ncbi:MAG: CIA30 family protein, partial [Caldilineaceae bacterium]|nr:CIA30 family protein [Caldilineaceae bacterium]
WSGDIATTTDLLNGILEKMTTLDDGAWELVFHNTDEPTHRAVFIESSDYHADNITVQLRNVTDSEQPVLIQGKWRSQVDRSTNTPFSFELALPAGTTSLSLPFPGLLDVTLVVESGNAQDKIYAGGGLWFDFSNSDSAETTMDLPQCRPLEDIDLSDLMLAGCTDLHGTAVGQSDEVGLGRTLNPNGRPVDVSPYRGLRFWAKGDGTPIRVVLETAAVTDSDHYQAIFTPDDEWRQYILPLEAFAQRGFGAAVPFTGRDVKAVIWTNASVPGGALQLSVDQVSFTNHGLVTADTLPNDSADTNARQIAVNTSASGSIRTMDLYYSLNDGESFIALPMDSAGDDIQFVATLPGQELGSDVLFYIVAEDQNGYRSQSPIDAPASLFRYRVDDRDGLLIDDFAGESLRNRQDGRAGVF